MTPNENMTAQESVIPWWEAIKLRPEVLSSDGTIDDVQMSLHNAVFGKEGIGAGSTPYADPAYYGDITHPTGSLVRIMGRIAVRLGVANSKLTEAVWRLDQAMGGGKSHGLIGLWHLAAHPRQLASTDLGKKIMAEADEIAGKGKIRDDLGNPICVVLDCDNTTATQEDFGPAKQLGERFLWRLFNTDYDLYIQFKDHISNKAKLAEALRVTGRPVLVLIDEIMDYLRATSAANHKVAVSDMAFLRALLDVVNDVPNCAAVLVMIASEADDMAMTDEGKELRLELEALLTRNASTTAVTSGGDFAEIIQKRLFSSRPPETAVKQVAEHYLNAMTTIWRSKVFDKLDSFYTRQEFSKQVSRCYPFHPALIALAENEWAHQAGFQRVRSTIKVFAAATYEHISRAQDEQWAPLLIDSGDLSLRSPQLRDALLAAGLVADTRTQANLREVAGTDIADPHNPDRGTARHIDETRDPNLGWNALNPFAAERMATALFVRSLCPRPQGIRGASEAELHAAAFVPSNAFGPGDAEAVAESLLDTNDGLASADHTPGQGKSVPKRWFIETRQTLSMLTRAEKKAISDTERDTTITERAFALATDGPFSEIVTVDGGPVPPTGITTKGSLGAIENAGIDRKHKTRLIILDSRWFSLLNGDDTTTREAITAAMGIGQDALTVQWASSAIFACANTALRSQARGLATEWLACQRVTELPAVQADEQNSQKARQQAKEAKEQLDRKVRLCYRHIAYLAPKADYDREVKFIRVHSDTQSALNGADVWGCLRAESKAFGTAEFNKNALLHNLRDNDYGRPLSEIRDSFWSDPHKPLLPTRTSELAAAIYDAVVAGDIELASSDGSRYQVGDVGDINLGSQSIRIYRASIKPPEPTGDAHDHPRNGANTEPTTPHTDKPEPQSPKPPKPPATHMQVTISVNTSIGLQESEALFHLLSEIAERIDDSDATHINQTTQITIANSNETETKLRELAENANASINILQI